MVLSLNATHYNNETEYNLHNLFGHMMAKRTYDYFTSDQSYPNTDSRSFILSRSTFASSGKYAAHTLGDNQRTWDYLRYSISGIMNMNMFGIPLVGADICGSNGTTRNDELCARWVQLATFYPLPRFHYNKGSDANEAWNIKDVDYN
jgi:alpha-glucosidase